MRALVCGLTLCVAMGACGGADAGPDVAATVRDSAGVDLVEFPGELPGRPIHLELVWEHGHRQDDYPFGFVGLGAIRSDGGAVVGDGRNRELVALSASGSGYRVLAGTGEGPGEVSAPRAVERFGRDSLWVEDRGNAKLMLFVGDSLTRVLSTLAGGTGTRGLMPDGVDVEGRLLMTTGSFLSDFEQDWLSGSMVRFDPASGAVDTVASYPMAPRTPDQGVNPFGGNGYGTSAGGGFVSARMDLPVVTWRGADGAVTRIVRWNPERAYPDEELWDRFEASLRGNLVRVNPQLAGDQLQQFVDDQLAGYEMDRSVPIPVFGRIVGAAAGPLWLADYAPGSAFPTGYTVMGPEDDAVGHADFPYPFKVIDATADHVLGVFVDEMDVQAVALYRYGPIS